jgi:hypothetical protein
MSDAPAPDTQTDKRPQARNAVIIAAVAIVLMTVGLVLIAVALAANAETAGPGVRVVRDLLIIVMALELVVIGAAITVLLVQVARFINLVNNELQPLVTSASDTINAIRGTAVFISKNLTEPIINIQGTLKGLAKAAKDVETIQKAAGIFASAAAASSPTGAHSTPSAAPAEDESAEQAEDTAGAEPEAAGEAGVKDGDEAQSDGDKVGEKDSSEETDTQGG